MRGYVNSSRKTCHSATLCRSGEFASQWRSSPTDKHSAWKANPACEAAQAKGGQDPALLACPARPGGDTHVQRQMASLGVVTAPRGCCVRGNIPNRTNTSTQPLARGTWPFPWQLSPSLRSSSGSVESPLWLNSENNGAVTASCHLSWGLSWHPGPTTISTLQSLSCRSTPPVTSC